MAVYRPALGLEVPMAVCRPTLGLEPLGQNQGKPTSRRLNALKCWPRFPEPIALLSTSVPTKLRAGMVNYHDPHTMAREGSACAFPSGSGACSSIIPSFFSTAASANLNHVFTGLFM